MGALATLIAGIPAALGAALIGNTALNMMTSHTTVTPAGNSQTVTGPTISTAAFTSLGPDAQKQILAAGYHIV